MHAAKRSFVCSSLSSMMYFNLHSEFAVVSTMHFTPFLSFSCASMRSLSRSHKGDPSPKGVVKFDAYSTVTVSPLNMM